MCVSLSLCMCAASTNQLIRLMDEGGGEVTMRKSIDNRRLPLTSTSAQHFWSEWLWRMMMLCMLCVGKIYNNIMLTVAKCSVLCYAVVECVCPPINCTSAGDDHTFKLSLFAPKLAKCGIAIHSLSLCVASHPCMTIIAFLAIGWWLIVSITHHCYDFCSLFRSATKRSRDAMTCGATALHTIPTMNI